MPARQPDTENQTYTESNLQRKTAEGDARNIEGEAEELKKK